MDNRNPSVGMEYHETTKHSYASVRTDMHFLDWANEPSPFKTYRCLHQVALPTGFPHPTTPALQALAESTVAAGGSPDLASLAALLYFSGGLTKVAKLSTGGTFYFRAAACAGALYPTEFYLVCGDLQGLEQGVYHFSPREFALSRLRSVDARQFLSTAAADKALGCSPATVVLTAITWRSAWKYQARSYRYHFWDAGTILANLLTTASALGIEARVVMGFVDGDVAHLLGVDGRQEKPLALVPLGREGSPPPSGDLPPVDVEVEPVSPREGEYPMITAIHSASALTSPAGVAAWRVAPPKCVMPSGAGPSIALEPLAPGQGRPLAETILRRGSSRVFRHEPIGFQAFSTILEATSHGPSADFLPAPDATLLDMYLIVNAIEDLAPGAYYMSRTNGTLETLRAGSFRNHSGYLCLEQDLGADAAAVAFFMADLEAVLGRYGNRGYRAAQMEAGILGGRMYLAAYALRLGATGLTFYDDDVTEFFSPHAKGKEPMFVVAMGRGAKAPSIRARPLVKPGRSRGGTGVSPQ